MLGWYLKHHIYQQNQMLIKRNKIYFWNRTSMNLQLIMPSEKQRPFSYFQVQLWWNSQIFFWVRKISYHFQHSKSQVFKRVQVCWNFWRTLMTRKPLHVKPRSTIKWVLNVFSVRQDHLSEKKWRSVLSNVRFKKQKTPTTLQKNSPEQSAWVGNGRKQ